MGPGKHSKKYLCFQEFKKTLILASEIDDEDIPQAQ
jgi:hypothetical protein